MNDEKYEFVRVHKNMKEFKFYSSGPNGNVEMMIQFQRINLLTCNLAMEEQGRMEAWMMLIMSVIKTETKYWQQLPGLFMSLQQPIPTELFIFPVVRPRDAGFIEWPSAII